MPSLSEATQKPKDTKRIFFALWPDDDLRSQLNQNLSSILIQSSKNKTAKRVPMKNWHITLAFIGNVSSQTCMAMQEKMDQLDKLPAFPLQLDSFGYWKRPQVAWLGCSTVPEELQQLVTSMNSSLAACGYTSDHPSYTPHMTLLRKARRGIKADKPVYFSWQVNEFVLVESKQTSAGSQYEVIRRWPLSP